MIMVRRQVKANFHIWPKFCNVAYCALKVLRSKSGQIQIGFLVCTLQRIIRIHDIMELYEVYKNSNCSTCGQIMIQSQIFMIIGLSYMHCPLYFSHNFWRNWKCQLFQYILWKVLNHWITVCLFFNIC